MTAKEIKGARGTHLLSALQACSRRESKYTTCNFCGRQPYLLAYRGEMIT
jgi:hypothetical protein